MINDVLLAFWHWHCKLQWDRSIFLLLVHVSSFCLLPPFLSTRNGAFDVMVRAAVLSTNQANRNEMRKLRLRRFRKLTVLRKMRRTVGARMRTMPCAESVALQILRGMRRVAGRDGSGMAATFKRAPGDVSTARNARASHPNARHTHENCIGVFAATSGCGAAALDGNVLRPAGIDGTFNAS
jgi:hypothetical protein